jgi:hypothetical protein
MESIHQVLYAIVNLHIKSETPGSLAPSTVDCIGKFMVCIRFSSEDVFCVDKNDRTLHKIYTFLEAQQEGNKIKQLFRQSEINALLKDCQAGSNEAFGIFKV